MAKRLGGKGAASLFSAIVLAVVAIEAFGGGAAAASGGGGWKSVASPHGFAHDSQLLSVAAISPTDVWAAGYKNHPRQVKDRPLMEHWDGISWARVAVPFTPGVLESFQSVSATATDDVWAAGTGYDNGFFALIEHFDGKTWSIAAPPKLPKAQPAPYDVVAIAPDEAWVVGQLMDQRSQHGIGLALHWDGTSWSSIPVPPPPTGTDILRSVEATSGDDVWAVGEHIDRHNVNTTLTMHWDGTSWTRIASPNVGFDDYLFGVAGSSDSDVWAVGEAVNGSHPHQPIVEHWDGGSWQVVTIAEPPHPSAALSDVVVAPGGYVWVVGSSGETGAPGTPVEAFSERLSGSTWVVVPMQHRQMFTAIGGVAALPDGELWAVGGKANEGDPQPLIEHYS